VWDKIFEVNVKAAYLLSKEVLPHLRKRHGGSIVYISSIAGFDPLGVSIENYMRHFSCYTFI
jgi:dehydrogenase/reductase SDR family protein 4